jgi:membrane-anchored protein YejM (alkaline phosphatase superfamily)
LLLALQGYLVMVVIRTAAMYLLPLDPPPLLIPLKDPFVQYFGSGEVPTKDLFFSGHTATLFLLFLTVHGRYVKSLFLLSTIGVAVCVVLQHVHYTIDVFSAPFFSYAAYRIVAVLRNKI